MNNNTTPTLYILQVTRREVREGNASFVCWHTYNTYKLYIYIYRHTGMFRGDGKKNNNKIILYCTYFPV